MFARKKPIKIIALAVGVLAVTVVVYAAGSKKPNEACTADAECRKGHCYTKKTDGKQVCVDCSSSVINRYRDSIQKSCKEGERACKAVQELEVEKRYFDDRIKANQDCIEARKDENKDCWDSGDEGHKKAVTDSEKALDTCTRIKREYEREGRIYTCSESTYNRRAGEVARYCEAYGNACDSMSKDSKPVDCNEVQKSMDKTDACVTAVENLDRDCLPQLSRKRENQFRDSKTAYDKCKQILTYKKENKLCK